MRNTAYDSNADKCKLPRKKGVNIAHLNTDSLSSKVDQSRHFMYSFKFILWQCVKQSLMNTYPMM